MLASARKILYTQILANARSAEHGSVFQPAGMTCALHRSPVCAVQQSGRVSELRQEDFEIGTVLPILGFVSFMTNFIF